MDLVELGAGCLSETLRRLVRGEGPPGVLALLEHGEEDVTKVVARAGEVQHERVFSGASGYWGGDPCWLIS